MATNKKETRSEEIKPIILKDKETGAPEYTLDFDLESIKFAESRGFDPDVLVFLPDAPQECIPGKGRAYPEGRPRRYAFRYAEEAGRPVQQSVQLPGTDGGIRKKRSDDGGDVSEDDGLILTDEERAELASLKPSSVSSYTEVFEEQCPIYMSYGMSWHDYWYGDPRAFRYYREAEAKRQEALNNQAWLQGIYIYKAVTTALTNAFAKKGSEGA